MSKKNNKGFSLIDVIIAVAVLSLLISPIIGQIITTVNTSSRAKERQYVIDDADLVMDYFRSTSIKELNETGDKGNEVTIHSVTPFEVDCELYKSTVTVDSNGEITGASLDLSSAVKTIKYNVTDYELASSDDPSSVYQILGRENNRYTRVVSLDDLSNKVLENSYKVNYRVDQIVEKWPSISGDLTNKGFVITNDGNAVKYDSEGHVVAAIVTENSVTYTNPNNATPYITDIDSNKMAIIQGETSSIDSTFQNDFVGNLVKIVQDNKKTLEQQGKYEEYQDRDKLNEFFDIAKDSNDFYRTIKLTVVGEDIVDNKPSHYRVKCEVFYKTKFEFLDKVVDYTDSYNDKYRYTVFNQVFNTAEPPDVFFIYEPFVLKTDADYKSYSSIDFIKIKSDKYTSGAVKGYDPSKVYLIKADSTWAEAIVDKHTPEEIDDLQDQNDTTYNFFTRTEDEKEIPVRINLNYVKDTNDASILPLQVITNISWVPNGTTGHWDEGEPRLNGGIDGIPQFAFGVNTSDFQPDPGFSSNESSEAYPYTNGTTHSDVGKIHYPDETKLEDRYAVIPPTGDTIEYGRLYSITVKYNNIDRNTENNTGKSNDNQAFIYFTGAKGAD